MWRRLFLGKPLHWAALLLALAILGWTGLERLQATGFNLYTAVLAATAAALVGVVVATTRRGERVTRDPIPPTDEPDHPEFHRY